MALTPSDVEQKTFSTALRGYDLDEVDDFLDEVVTALRGLEDEVTAAKAEAKAAAKAAPAVAAVPAHVASPAPAADESAVGRVLITAQNAADSMIAEAQDEAGQIVQDAKSEAETWSDERDQKKADADAEMTELSDHVAGVRTQLAVLATAVADRLDEMDQAIDGEASSELDEDVDEDVDEDEGIDEDVAEPGNEDSGRGGSHEASGDDTDEYIWDGPDPEPGDEDESDEEDTYS